MYLKKILKNVAAGMDAHLGKPLDFDAVKDTIKKYLS